MNSAVEGCLELDHPVSRTGGACHLLHNKPIHSSSPSCSSSIASPAHNAIHYPRWCTIPTPSIIYPNSSQVPEATCGRNDTGHVGALSGNDTITNVLELLRPHSRSTSSHVHTSNVNTALTRSGEEASKASEQRMLSCKSTDKAACPPAPKRPAPALLLIPASELTYYGYSSATAAEA